MNQLLVHLLNPNAHAPRKLPGSIIGYDLFALQAQMLDPYQQTPVRTGITIAAPIGWGAIVVDSPDTIKAGRFVFSKEVNVNGRDEVIVNMGFFMDPTREPRDPCNAMRQRIRAGEKIGHLILVPIPDFEVMVQEAALAKVIPFPMQEAA